MAKYHHRHINEFQKTSLANSGRCAGMGMLYDNYDDESGRPNYEHREHAITLPPGYSSDPSRMDGSVVTYKLINDAKIKLNSNEDFVSTMKKAITDNDGHCPCAIEKTEDTKCMCKLFRDKLSAKELGECGCGLYTVVEYIDV